MKETNKDDSKKPLTREELTPMEQMIYDIIEIIERANPVSLEDRAKAIIDSGVDLSVPYRPKPNPNIEATFDGESIRLIIRQDPSEE